MHTLTLAKAKKENLELKKEILKEKREKVFWRNKYEDACVDSLTKLPRRNFVENRHKVLVGINKRRIKSGPKPITLVVFDIDNFKDVNDTYGHSEGDTILKHVAQILNISKRPNDVLVRFGGEEFVALLSDIDNEKSSHAFVDRIRALVHSTCKLPNHSYVSISAGVVVDLNGNLSFDELFKKADTNLYVAKNSGRNCVISSET